MRPKARQSGWSNSISSRSLLYIIVNEKPRAPLAKMSADNGDEDEKTTTTVWTRPFVLVFLVARKLGTGRLSISLSLSLSYIVTMYMIRRLKNKIDFIFKKLQLLKFILQVLEYNGRARINVESLDSLTIGAAV